MDLQLQGLRAVVTGGSAGIGAAIVQALAAEGCAEVHFCGRSQARIEAALRGMPPGVRGRALDVTDAEQLQQWFDGIGGFDIFIPNVSALSGGWAATLATDIEATVRATEAAVPHLAASRHAAITYIGSKAGALAAPRSAAYGAGKAAMAHYMKSLSARLLPAVRVNTVSPGDVLIEDGFWDRIRQQEPEVYQGVVARNPLQRLARAEEIARVVAFVSSPAASFVAGANWYVDGGSVSHVQF